VRDVYDLGDSLLLVSTDRISAFDVVFNEGIPFKGLVLNQLSRYWFRQTRGVVKNHVKADDFEEFPEKLREHPELDRRSMLATKLKMYPIECVVRGFLAGGGWRDYQKTGGICGIALPKGMKENDQLPEPIFTPSTKAETGHDENITFDQMAGILGSRDDAEELREATLRIYDHAYKHALTKGIVIVDTKFEFGTEGDGIVLADELLTPDSSRFWYKAAFDAGRPEQMDKEFMRKYLLSTAWDRTPPAPSLPQNIVDETSRRYLEILKALTGEEIVRPEKVR
jgi:phosphoribosylaminoimidazole-succinocarboxamide synthase